MEMDVYLDRLSLSSFLYLSRLDKSVDQVNVLCQRNRFDRLIIWLLGLYGINVKHINFNLASLKQDNGHGVMLAGLNLASDISLSEADVIISGDKTFARINEKFSRDTLKLYIAKYLQSYFYYWTVRPSIAIALSDKKPLVLMKSPLLVTEERFQQWFPDADVFFYNQLFGKTIGLISSLSDCLRFLKVYFNREKNSNDQLSYSVLSLHEDNVCLNDAVRCQPHWYMNDEKQECGKVCILRQPASKNLTVEDEIELRDKGVYINSLSLLRLSRNNSEHRVFQDLLSMKSALYLSILNDVSFVNITASLKLLYLIKMAELMAGFCIKYKVKVFLFSEAYPDLCNAMLLIAPVLGIKTIGYQYSSLWRISPSMMSTPDKLIVFSDIYQKVYEFKKIRPVTFISGGYVFNNIKKSINARVVKNRKKLRENGAKFIISYFDEAVQHEACWGLTSVEDHLSKIQSLAHVILNYEDVGLIVKSQFLKNSPKVLHKSDSLIQMALQTGRFLELNDGSIGRNGVFPAEAALSSDFCIGHKIGSTAALESAVYGVRTVMLDEYGIFGFWDALYEKGKILYTDINELIQDILLYHQGDSSVSNLGDWSDILSHFNYSDNLGADVVLREEVRKSLEDFIDPDRDP